MKHEKISIKWKIFFYLLIFTGVLLVVLWLIQICYLDSFYKMIKTGEAEKIVTDATAVLQSGSENVADELDELAAGNNMGIFVTNLSGEELYSAEYIANSRMNGMPEDQIQLYYEKAKENGGSAKIEFEGSINKTFLTET